MINFPKYINGYVIVNEQGVHTRETYLDCVCGILILNMIFGHIEYMTGIKYSVLGNYLSFFMPWFFYKAGVFSKQYSVPGIIKSFKRLIIPFIVYSIISEIIYRLPALIHSDILQIGKMSINAVKAIVLTGTVVGNMSLWFLLSLFIVKMIVTMLIKYKVEWVIVCICSFAPISHIFDLNFPLYFGNISTGSFFFYTGYKLKNYRIIDWRLAGTLLLAWLICMYMSPNLVDMKLNELREGSFFMWYVTSLIGIFAINSTSRLLNINISVLNYIGKNSLGFLCIHGIIMTCVGFMYTQEEAMNNNECTAVLILGMAMVIPTIIYLLRKKSVKYLS